MKSKKCGLSPHRIARAGWQLIPVAALVFTVSLAAQNEDAAAEEAEIVTLSPFIVDGSGDRGYDATETLAGSRLRTNVGDLGGAMDILTLEFMEDIGADDFDDALLFATNTDSSDPGLISGSAGAAARDDVSYTVRGFKISSLSRDFFGSLYKSDQYNTSRMTFSRGPNSILYGIAQPGGIANSSSLRAIYRDTNKLTANVDTNGGHRETATFNRVLIDKKLSFVVAGLNKDKRDWIDDVFTEDKRLHTAINFRPFAGNDTSWKDLEINMTYETGKAQSQILGRSEPITDGVSEWIAAGRPVFDNINLPDGVPDGVELIDANSRLIIAKGTPSGADVPAMNWAGTYIGSAPTQARSLLDNSIIPKDVNYLGSSASKFEDFQTTQLFINKKFGKLYLDLAYNKQDHSRKATEELRSFKLEVDPNMYLPTSTPDNLIPNPNAGQFYVQGDLIRYQPLNRRVQRTYRASVSYDLDFRDNDNIFRHLGRFRFAAMQQKAKIESAGQFSRLVNMTPNLTNQLLVTQGVGGEFPEYDGTKKGFIEAADLADRTKRLALRNSGLYYNSEGDFWIDTAQRNNGGYTNAGQGWIVNPETGERILFPLPNNGTNPKNSMGFRSYIDPSIGFYASGGATPQFAGYDETIFGDSATVNDGYSVEGIPGAMTDENGITPGLVADLAGGQGYAELTSEVYTMQHYLFGGRMVTTLGWRSDDRESWGINQQIKDSRNDNNYYYFPNPAQFDPRATDDDYEARSGDPTTRSVVIKPTQNISFFYSEADNFNPSGQANSIFGEFHPSPTGLGKDYGIRINLGQKFSLTASAFETTSQNEREAKIRTGQSYPTDNAGRVSDTFWINMNRIQGLEGFGTEDDTNYQESPYRHSEEVDWVGIQSTQSKGVELRFTYNPTKQLRMLFNFATQDSKVNSTAPELYRYWHEFVPSVLAAHPEYNTDTNPVTGEKLVLTGVQHRFITYADRPGVDANGDPLLDSFGQALTNYATTIPEMVKGAQDDVTRLLGIVGYSDSRQANASANFVSSYTFKNDSSMKGWSFGVNARWRDVRTIGYPILPGEGQLIDAANPYEGGDTLSTGGFIRLKKKFGNVNWTGQIQIENLFNSVDLVPFGTDNLGSGEIVRYKYQAPRQIDFRNTFTF